MLFVTSTTSPVTTFVLFVLRCYQPAILPHKQLYRTSLSSSLCIVRSIFFYFQPIALKWCLCAFFSVTMTTKWERQGKVLPIKRNPPKSKIWLLGLSTWVLCSCAWLYLTYQVMYMMVHLQYITSILYLLSDSVHTHVTCCVCVCVCVCVYSPDYTPAYLAWPWEDK